MRVSIAGLLALVVADATLAVGPPGQANRDGRRSVLAKRQTINTYPPALVDWEQEERYTIMDNDYGSTAMIP